MRLVLGSETLPLIAAFFMRLGATVFVLLAGTAFSPSADGDLSLRFLHLLSFSTRSTFSTALTSCLSEVPTSS
jgi:hypothetical protein